MRSQRLRGSSLLTGSLFALGLSAASPAAVQAQTRSYALVPLANSNHVAVVDTATNTVLTPVATGLQPVATAVASHGRLAYVVNETGGSLTVVDVATLAAVGTIAVGSTPHALAIAPDNSRALVTRTANDAVGIVDLSTNTLIGTVPLPGASPAGVAFSPGGSTAYVAGNGLHRIDVASGVSTGTIALSGAASALVLTRDGATAFATIPSLNVVQLVDLGSFTAGATIAVGTSPTQLALSPDGAALYVTNTASNSVSVVDVPTRAAVATIPVGTTPRGVSFRPDGQRAYAANTGSGTLSIIDTATRTVVGTAGIGSGPTAYGASFVTPPLIVPTGGPLSIATDAGLESLGFRDYLPFLGGTLQTAGPFGFVTSRHVSLLAPGGTIDPFNAAVELHGNVSGPGTLTLSATPGIGTELVLGGTAAHTGGTVITRGFLTVNGTHTVSPITLATSVAQLRGSGTVGSVNALGGIVSPGGSTFGVLRASQVTFAPGARLAIWINGTQHTALDVSGTTALNGAALSVTSLNQSPVGQPLVVATNATGTFEDLPEGAILLSPGTGASYYRYSVSYTGGDGNDVALTKVNDPPYFMNTVGPQTTPDGVPLTVFTAVADINPQTLTRTATSSNQALVTDAGLTFNGSMLTISPEIGMHGTATITMSVSDGIDSTSTTFELTVTQTSYYLAEGSTGSFFDTVIAIANPNPQTATYNMKFLLPGGGTIERAGGLAPYQQEAVLVDQITGLESTSFSTIVSATNNLPLIVERTMSWDATGYGAHTEKAANGLGTSWYFAEGSQGYFSTYYLLANPHPTVNHAHVTFYREGAPPVTRDYTLPPKSRTTVDAGAIADLRNRSFGALVTFDRPGSSERAMYFGGSPLWQGGHSSSGAPAAATSWFLAEGATGSYFTTFILVANPNSQDVDVTLTYLPASGAPVTRVKTLPAGERLTINVALEDASLADAAVGTRITAPLPIVAERSQYWGSPAWIEAHNSSGVTAASTRWGVADGRVGGLKAAQTYILLANPGTQQAIVTASFLRYGFPPLVKTFTVAPNSRFNIGITGAGGLVPELVEAGFGALIESSQPIVVEKSIYWNAGGVVWAAGTNATATLLP